MATVKKTSQKNANKKTVKKSISKKAASQKIEIGKASPEKAFWVHYGPILSDVRDLERALREIGDDTFAYHVNKFKNDFACWVRDVFEDRELASKLARNKTKKGAHDTVVRHLKIKHIP